MRLIDADALKEEWKNGFYRKIVDALMDEAPTIDAQPVRHGRWVKKGAHSYCTECGAMMNLPWYWYCGKCGAKMDAADNQRGGAENG